MAKRTVQECLCLDVFALGRKGALAPGKRTRVLFSTGQGREMGRVFLQAEADWIDIPLLRTPDVKVTIHPAIDLVWSLTSFGGRRAQFLCPGCGAPRAKLYLPPAETRFLCRVCHDLAYQSQQAGPRGVGRMASKRLERLSRQAHLLAEEVRLLKEAELSKKRTRGKVIAGNEESEGPCSSAPLPRARGRPKTKRPYLRTRPFLSAERQSASERLCLRCRAWRVPTGPVPVVLASGRSALRSRCPVCGAVMVMIVRQA
jgi:hypothetical protein